LETKTDSNTPQTWKGDEQSDATERKWRSEFLLKSRSLAPSPPADRQRSPHKKLDSTLNTIKMIWPFHKKEPAAIEPSDRWYVEIDEQPVAIIDNPADSGMFWFTWELHPLDGNDLPTDLWDYSMDSRRSFRHVVTSERSRYTIPAGKGAILPDGRVLLRGPLQGRDYNEYPSSDEP
jgi:hypothetical protein